MLYMYRTILVHHQEQPFISCTSHLLYSDTSGSCVLTGMTGASYNHTTARRMVPAYTKCDVQLIKVAPDDGLIQSETCRASNGK